MARYGVSSGFEEAEVQYKGQRSTSIVRTVGEPQVLEAHCPTCRDNERGSMGTLVSRHSYGGSYANIDEETTRYLHAGEPAVIYDFMGVDCHHGWSITAMEDGSHVVTESTESF